ncbi:MAG: hypothetical protein WCI92_13835 [Bacteroidota bacterium]
MKKLSVLLILVMSVLILKAGPEVNGYVTVDGKTYFCESVKSGLKYMNLTMADKTIMKVPFNKVDAYSCNGRLFERLPVKCKWAPANCTALMEYVTTRGGLRLYKYCKVQEHGEFYDCSFQSAHAEYEFFVFKDGKFYLHVTQENAESVLPFFGIPTI